MQRQNLVLASLVFVIVLLTAFAVGREPQKLVLGALAPLIVPTILTLYFLVILAYGKVIMDILAVFLLSRPQRAGHHGNLLATIIGWAIVMGVLVLLVRSGVAERMIKIIQESAATLTSAALSSLNLPESNTSTPSSMNLMLYYYTVLVFGGVVVLSMILFVGGLHRAARFAREEIQFHARDQVKKETLQVVRQAVTELRSSNDYGEIIIKCYKEMINVLSRHGLVTTANETAREFAGIVSGKLRLGSEAVRGLTFLFEEARYSDHKMDDAKRLLALGQLSCLENSLAHGASDF